VPIGAKSDGSNVFAVLERKGKGLVTMERMRKLDAGASMGYSGNQLDQIKHGHSVAHRTEHGIAVGSEYDVSLLIDSTA